MEFNFSTSNFSIISPKNPKLTTHLSKIRSFSQPSWPFLALSNTKIQSTPPLSANRDTWVVTDNSVPHIPKKMELTSKKKQTSKETDVVNTATSIQLVKFVKFHMLPAKMGKFINWMSLVLGHCDAIINDYAEIYSSYARAVKNMLKAVHAQPTIFIFLKRKWKQEINERSWNVMKHKNGIAQLFSALHFV